MLNRVRELRKESKGKIAAGFTIIEVMIVLAIAGLIMAIVFMAIPALQRNNRNTQRKNDVSRLAGLINDYISNNQGSLPTAIASGAGSTAGTLYYGTDKFSIITVPAAVAAYPATLPTAPAADTALIYKGANCGGTNNPVATTSNRSFAIWYGIEGSTTTQCVDS